MNLLRRPISRRRRREARTLRVRMEALETRTVLSTMIVPSITAYLEGLATSTETSDVDAAATVSTPSSSAISPWALISAYGFSTSATAGLGTTIAIVGAYDNPTIQADLAAFSTYYGLATASLTVVNQYGETTNLPEADAGWSLETAMDVEWAHAVAPGAKLILVEAESSSVSDMMTAVQTAAWLADVVTMSWGGSEWLGQKVYDTTAYFANASVTFVAASGDDGGAYGVSWPASSPYVLSVGGTTLSLDGTESAWSASGSPWSGISGSTGGVSRVEALPSYQASALGTRAASGRVVPDVASVADPSTGLAVYSTASGLSQTGWFTIGGTSAGAPVWAGLVANADQARLEAGKSVLSTTQTLTLLYSMYGTSTYASAFDDVTSGSNFAGSATVGYDMVTGLGSPEATTIIAAATSYTTTTTTTVRTTPVRVVRVRPRARIRAHGIGEDAGEADSTATETADSTTVTEITVVDAQLTSVTTSSSSSTSTSTDAATGTTALTVTQEATTVTATATAMVSLTTATVSEAPNQPIAATPSWSSTEPQVEEPPIAPSVPVAPLPVRADADPGVDPVDAEAVEPAPDDRPEPASDPVTPPADEMEIWDEALEGVQVVHSAPIGWGRPSDEEEAGAPRLAIGLGLVAAFGQVAHARRRSRRNFSIPIPSRN